MMDNPTPRLAPPPAPLGHVPMFFLVGQLKNTYTALNDRFKVYLVNHKVSVYVPKHLRMHMLYTHTRIIIDPLSL